MRKFREMEHKDGNENDNENSLSSSLHKINIKCDKINIHNYSHHDDKIFQMNLTNPREKINIYRNF